MPRRMASRGQGGVDSGIPDAPVRRLSFTAARASRSSRILDGSASALSTITGMFRVRGSSRRRRNTSYNEYVGFGLRSDDSRDRMEEAVEVLTRAWTEEPLVHDGKFFSVRLPAIRPRPV